MPTSETVTAAPDAALLARLRAGDDDAFADLVRSNTARLLSVARRILRHEQEAQDAVQEAFLCAFRALRSFEGTCLLSTWLHRIAVNACLMRLRRRERKREEPIDAFLPARRPEGRAVEPFAQWEGSAASDLERKETRALVRSCIDRLPATQRTALLLRDIEEMESGEAAALLGITPNALKIRVHRARQALRTLIDPYVERMQISA